MMHRSHILFLASALLPGCCLSQVVPAAEKQKPSPQVCVVPVGAPSDNVAEWKSETVFSFKATDEGATPPMDLFYQQSVDGKKVYHLFPFNLGIATPPIPVSQSSLVLYRAKKSKEEKDGVTYTPDQQFELRDTPLTALILWRDKSHPEWKKPNVLSVDASPQAWPPGQVRFLNLARVPIRLTLTEGNYQLDPAGSHSVDITAGQPHPYRIDAAVNDKWAFICSNAVSMLTPARTLIVVYGNQKGVAESMEIGIPMPLAPAPPGQKPTEGVR